MIDYLLSSHAPAKGAALAETGLPSLVVNVALAAAVIILKPAVELYLGLTIDKHTPISLDNRQSLNAILYAGHDFISPVLDGLSTIHLEVKPEKAAIATAVTIINYAPTPVQLLQEQSTMGVLLGIAACAVLALLGTVLVFQHSRQGTSASGASLPPTSSDDGSSSPPSGRDSTPPTDDLSNEPSGSGGHPPPVPIYNIFYDGPIPRVDKAVDTNDEKEVGDMDGAPPPPPPSFPTSIEDGDAFKGKMSIVRWSSLTLVLSIISFVINRLFTRFFKFKGHGKTQKNVFTPTASERITANEIGVNVMAPFSGNVMTPIPIPSVTVKPVITSTCPNMLPLVETQSLDDSISTIATVGAWKRSRIFPIIIIFILLLGSLVLVPCFLQAYIDNRLEKIINFFFPAGTWGQSLKVPDVVEITSSIEESTSIEGENTAAAGSINGEIVAASVDEEKLAAVTDEEDIAAVTDEEDIAAVTDEEDIAAVTDEEDIAAVTDEEDITAVTDEENIAAVTDEEDFAAVIDEEGIATVADEEDIAAVTYEEDVAAGGGGEKSDDSTEISFTDIVGAGETTLIVFGMASPLAVDLKDIFDASEDGIPFHEVFSALSISSSSDGIPALKERSKSFTNPVFRLPKTCTVSGSQDIRVLSKTNISVVAEQAQTLSKSSLEKTALAVQKVSSAAKIETVSKERVPIVNVKRASALARAGTLPVRMKSSATNIMTSSTESLNPKAASFLPPSYLPVIQQPRRSSSTGLHRYYSPPSPPRRSSSASMHAPSPQRKGLSASIHAPSSPPKQGLSASIHVPSPCTPPKKDLNASIHAPIEHELELPKEPMPIPVVDLSPERRGRRISHPQRECNVVVLVSGGLSA